MGAGWKQVALAGVHDNGMALRYVAPSLQADPEVTDLVICCLPAWTEKVAACPHKSGAKSPCKRSLQRDSLLCPDFSRLSSKRFSRAV